MVAPRHLGNPIFLPKNSPRRGFSISSTQTSITTTDPSELQMDTSCASPSYQRWDCTRCNTTKKPLTPRAR